MGLFDFLKKPAPPKNQTITGNLITETYSVAGVQYYRDDIHKLAVRNELWKKQTSLLLKDGKSGKRIFRYNFINKPVKLIPEPKNPHDKNAVIVQIAGEKVGYIPAESALHVKAILSKHDVKYISSFIGGGQYKIPCDDGSMIKDEEPISITVKIAYKK